MPGVLMVLREVFFGKRIYANTGSSYFTGSRKMVFSLCAGVFLKSDK